MTVKKQLFHTRHTSLGHNFGQSDELFKKHIVGGKIGVAATLMPKGLGPQNPTKKLAHWVDLLDQPLFQNCFQKSRA